tara:strand:+ start:843 stop:980 length:138 start_codon:yes stop_codon:yes gene_type:complete
MKYEEIPDEDLWEDGEIKDNMTMLEKVYYRVFVQGDWHICKEVKQ